jgi:LysM repeat protein
LNNYVRCIKLLAKLGKNLKQIKRATSFFIAAFLLVLCFPVNYALCQGEGEETYSISLVQTAEADKEIREVEGRKVLTETYTVEKGDHVWQLLRERGLLQKRELPELLAVLKRLNTSFTDLDLIYPGDKLIIPLTLSPVKGLAGLASKETVTPLSLADLKHVKLENYTVKPGDSFIKVVKSRYSLRDEQISPEYLEQLKRLNPKIADLNRIYPGQVVRLPVYRPQVVMAPIKPIKRMQTKNQLTQEKPEKEGKVPTALSLQLADIFGLIGEEWVNTGEHYIPLSSGGQINLKADSFPILNLQNGNQIIVDIHNELPERMSLVISSNWANYRVVHLQDHDNLRSALNKIFPLCGFYKLYRSGEPLELVSDVRLQLTADWIIVPAPAPGGKKQQTILIDLTDRSGPRIPHELKDFLAEKGVKTIEYPPLPQPEVQASVQPQVLQAGQDRAQIIETVLNLTGQAFTRNMEMPLYKGGNKEFNLTIKADFFLYLGKKEAIIDFSGIGADMIPLLKEYNVSVLSVANESDPAVIVSRVLDFTGVKFESKLHPFNSANKEESRNIRVTIPGIIFQDNHGQKIFASDLHLSNEIAGFLSSKGYKVLSLALS